MPTLPKTSDQQPGPLNGLRIVDLTRLYPGPLATQMLAQMGADILKIELPQAPDPMRNYPPFIDQQSAGYHAVNRGKASLLLDWKNPQGQQQLKNIIAHADIFIEAFRPGYLAQYHLDFQSLKRENPKLVYVSVTGYGQDGPYAMQAGHDINYIAASGLLDACQGPDGPLLPNAQIADVAGGAYLTTTAVLAGLIQAKSTGQGCHADISMLEGSLHLMTLQLAHAWATGSHPPPGEDMLSGGLPCYNTYPCKCGGHIALGALEPKFWQNLCEHAQKPHWKPHGWARGPQGQKMRAELRAYFRTQTRDHWVKWAENAEICLTPVRRLEELEQDPQLQARNVFKHADHPENSLQKTIACPIRFANKNAQPPEKLAPAPGQGGEAMLKSWQNKKQTNTRETQKVMRTKTDSNR